MVAELIQAIGGSLFDLDEKRHRVSQYISSNRNSVVGGLLNIKWAMDAVFLISHSKHHED